MTSSPEIWRNPNKYRIVGHSCARCGAKVVERPYCPSCSNADFSQKLQQQPQQSHTVAEKTEIPPNKDL